MNRFFGIDFDTYESVALPRLRGSGCSNNMVVLDHRMLTLALAFAFRSGHLGVMDYFNMRNVQADTEMRNSIAGSSGTAAGTASINATRNDRPPTQTPS